MSSSVLKRARVKTAAAKTKDRDENMGLGIAMVSTVVLSAVGSVGLFYLAPLINHSLSAGKANFILTSGLLSVLLLPVMFSAMLAVLSGVTSFLKGRKVNSSAVVRHASRVAVFLSNPLTIMIPVIVLDAACSLLMGSGMHVTPPPPLPHK